MLRVTITDIINIHDVHGYDNDDDDDNDCLTGLPSRILTCTELSGHWRWFVLVSSLYFFSGYGC